MARRSEFHKLLENLQAQREQRLNEMTQLKSELTKQLERIKGLVQGIDEAIDQVQDVLARRRREPKNHE
jgi:ABC-type transporter Mla subunit MlaD